MSLSESLMAPAASSLEAGAAAEPKLSLSYLTRHARSIVLSLTLLCSLLVAALAVVLFLLLSPSSSPSSPHVEPEQTPASQLPFFTTGGPHLIGQPPFIPRESVLARVGRDLDASRNLSVDPCDDFYQYSCGGWVAATTLPPGTSMITKGFQLAAAVRQAASHTPLLLLPLYTHPLTPAVLAPL